MSIFTSYNEDYVRSAETGREFPFAEGRFTHVVP
jgi:hypothetical protein